ncbi:MAG TPA: hypothetical protein VIK28_02635, partial [Sedimentisphaerales bacterium]
ADDRCRLGWGDIITGGEKGDAADEVKELRKIGQILRSGISGTHDFWPQLNRQRETMAVQPRN